jgi:hypothetical protein
VCYGWVGGLGENLGFALSAGAARCLLDSVNKCRCDHTRYQYTLHAGQHRIDSAQGRGGHHVVVTDRERRDHTEVERLPKRGLRSARRFDQTSDVVHDGRKQKEQHKQNCERCTQLPEGPGKFFEHVTSLQWACVEFLAFSSMD